MIMRWQQQDFKLKTDTPYRYLTLGLSIVRIVEEIYRVKTAPYCIYEIDIRTFRVYNSTVCVKQNN